MKWWWHVRVTNFVMSRKRMWSRSMMCRSRRKNCIWKMKLWNRKTSSWCMWLMLWNKILKLYDSSRNIPILNKLPRKLSSFCRRIKRYRFKIMVWRSSLRNFKKMLLIYTMKSRWSMYKSEKSPHGMHNLSKFLSKQNTNVRKMKKSVLKRRES